MYQESRLVSSLALLGFLLNVAAACSDGNDPDNRISNSSRQLAGAPAWVIQAESRVDSADRAALSPALAKDERLLHVVRRTVAGRRYLQFTAFAVADQTIRKATIDSDGVEVDFRALVSSASEPSKLARGVVSRALYDAACANQNRTFDVSLVARVPLDIDRTLSPAALRAYVASQVQTARIPLEDAVVLVQGTLSTIETYAPIVHARLYGESVLSLTHAPGVAAVREHSREVIKGSAQSSIDLGIGPVFHTLGYRGSGIKLGISGEATGTEAGCRIWDGHPAYQFTSINYSNSSSISCQNDADCAPCGTDGRCHAGVCTIQHGTQVAGMIGGLYLNVSPPARASADAANIYFANSDWNHTTMLGWFWQNGVVAENESWGGAITDSYAQDLYSIYGMAIVELAGNLVTAVASCGASNSLCVGGYATINPPTEFRGGWPWGSSFLNFTGCGSTLGCDREVPHFEFHGQNVTTTNNSSVVPYGLTSGTSFATPAAVGLVGLMNERWPSTFNKWPEATRAALMASADRDIDTPVAGKTYSDHRSPDEHDGAGVPNAARIEAMVQGSRAGHMPLYRATSFDSQNMMTLAYVYLAQNDVLRAVISWDGCPTTNIPANYGNKAHADLDLHVYSPSGALVATADSWDGTYEITEITAATSGTYMLRIKHYGWSDCPELGGSSNAKTFLGYAYDIR